MIFVYVQGMRGPAPEKWPEMLRDMNGKPKPTLAMHHLKDDEAGLGFDELMRRYPAPVTPKE